VAIAARVKSLPARSCPTPAVRVPRALALALAAAAMTLLSLALMVAPASAIVTELGATKVGLQPRNYTTVYDGNGELGASFNNPAGHPVLHSSRAYAIYWDPTASYHGDWQEVVDTFLRGAGRDTGALGNAFAVSSQYTDRSNQPASSRFVFQGAYTDTNGYPAPVCADPHALEPGDAITCLTDKQVQEELASFISQHGLVKGMGAIFYVLTPPGVTVCLDAGGPGGHCSDYTGLKSEASYQRSFCSYHADISPTNPTEGDANTILYAMIPWSAGGLGDFHLTEEDQTPASDCQNGAVQQEPNQLKGTGPDGAYDHGLADLIINQIAAEQLNTVTNPLLNAWQDSVRNENTDECRNFFAPKLGGSVTPQENTLAGTLFNEEIGGGQYYLNTAFNLAADRVPRPQPCQRGRNSGLRRHGVQHHPERRLQLLLRRRRAGQLRHLRVELRRRVTDRLRLRARRARLQLAVAHALRGERIPLLHLWRHVQRVPGGD
jgi:hypothetical protein